MEYKTMELITFVRQFSNKLNYVRTVLTKLKHYKGNKIPIPWGVSSFGDLMQMSGDYSYPITIQGISGYSGQWGTSRLSEGTQFSERLYFVRGNYTNCPLYWTWYTYTGGQLYHYDITDNTHYTVVSGESFVCKQISNFNRIDMDAEIERLSEFVKTHDYGWAYEQQINCELYNVKATPDDMDSWHFAFSIRRFPDNYIGAFPSNKILIKSNANKGECVLITTYDYSSGEFTQFVSIIHNNSSTVTYKVNYIN